MQRRRNTRSKGHGSGGHLAAELYNMMTGVIINQPDVRSRILSEGADTVGSTPEDFRKYLVADLAKWAKVVKESGAKWE